MYDESDDDSWGGSHHSGSDDETGLEPQGAQRAELERIMDDFLSKYEVIGGKFRPALQPLHGSGGAEDASLSANASRLDRLRHEMARLDLGEEEEGEDPEVTARRREKERILAIVERQDEEADKGGARKVPRVTILEEARRDRWDCETVLSASLSLSLSRLSLALARACTDAESCTHTQAPTRTCRTTRACSACATLGARAGPTRARTARAPPRSRSTPRRASRPSTA